MTNQMTEQIRKRIASVILAWIHENGNMPLRLLKSILRSKGISEAIVENIQPKLWVSKEFPELKVIGTNGREQIAVGNEHVAFEDTSVLQILMAAVSKEGKYLLSNIAPLLAAEGIEWRPLANGKKLYEWIMDSYPGAFVLSEDKLWLSKAVEITDEQKTRNYVYRFCYFPINSAGLKLIKELTGDESFTQAKWTSSRTFSLAQCLLGLNGGIFDDSAAETPRLAFYMGLKTLNEQDIYGILEQNPNQSASQKWIFSTAAFPGQNTEEGYWLCKTFGIKSQASYGDDRSKALNLISEALDKIIDVQQELSLGQDSVQDSIDDGRMLPDAVANLLLEYIKWWGKLGTAIQKLEGNQIENLDSIYSVQKFLDEMSDKNRVQEELAQKYTALAHAAWDFMRDNMLCPEDHSAEDIAAWNRLLQKNSTAKSFFQLRQMIVPYQAIMVLRSFNLDERGVLDDDEYNALDSINEHFRAHLKPAQLRHSICNKEIDMSFLGLLPGIDTLITEIENTHNQSMEENAPSASELDLLNAALEGRLWRMAGKAFRKPNKLEKAIMLGDEESIQKIVHNQDDLHSLGYDLPDENQLIEAAGNVQISKTVTPLFAAERLIQYLGRNSEVIDQCLLFSVMQQEDGAFEALMQHYLETDRPALASVLYRRAKAMLPVESRRHIVRSLVAGNCISVDEAIADDMLAFMTETGIQLLESIAMNEEERERLLGIYVKIQPAFIHHVVFLSPELQSYILRPENASELTEYFPSTKRAEIAEMLQRNAFERGTAPLQIAKRVFAFVGNWGDLALAFTYFSEENLARQEFLLKLLIEKGNDVEIIRFLNENASLKQAHLPFYFNLLFKNQMYEEICLLARGGDYALTTKQILQGFFASVKLGESTDDLPEFDSGEAVKHVKLLLEISEELAQCNPELHKEFLVRVFPVALQSYSEKELECLVAANGRLCGEPLVKIAAGTAARCPALAIFCDRLLDAATHEALRDSYLSMRYDAFSALGFDEQKKLAHELHMLHPEKYATLEENIFDDQLAEILDGDADADVKTEKIGELLRSSELSSTALSHAIARIGENSVFCHAKLYRNLLAFIEDDQSLVDFLKLLYLHWNQGDEEYKIFFCGQVIDAAKRDIMPADLLTEYEDCLLTMAGSLDAKDVPKCILQMEERRGREPYLSFAKNILGEISRREALDYSPSEEERSWEMALFCDAMEDESVDNDEYFRYCSMLIAASGHNFDMDSSLEDADAVEILRRLYQDPKSADCWDAVERMVPQSRIRARGFVLYYYARYLGSSKSEDAWLIENNNEQWTVGKANKAWERCVNYCLTEDLDDLFFMAIRSWLREINDYYAKQLPWYSMRHYMQTMQKILEDSDSVLHGELRPAADFPVCPEEIAVPLVSEAIDIFKRIDRDKADQIRGDDNHNSLRVVVELSLRLGCEDLLLEKLSEELSGAYVNLGLVAVCRLLLNGKTSFAMDFLKHIVNSAVKNYNYAVLMDRLATMSTEEEVELWMSEESNRATLRFILPNGNAPDIFRLQTLVMSTFSGDKGMLKNCVYVIKNLIECYPRDVMIYKSLFIICKEEYIEYLPEIYQALVGIFKYYHSKPVYVYTRDRSRILRLIEVLHQVMEQLGEDNPSYEPTTDLIRDYSHANDREDTDEQVSRLNQLSEELNSFFVGVNKGSNTYSLLIKSLLGSVTENWAPFFREAFKFRASNLVWTYYIDKYQSNWGMLRGILRVWQACPSEAERDEFVSWINGEIGSIKSSYIYKYVMRQLNNLVTKISFRDVNWSMLRLPWEEHFVCLGNLKDLSRVEKNCCYKVMMAERPKGQPAKDSFIVMIRVAQDYLKAQLLFGNAKTWFLKGDYDLAGAAYEALAITRVLPTNDKKKSNEYLEMYETWMRIAYVFAGTNSSPRHYSAHSCMNMMCALLNEGYVKNFDRLRGSFAGLNLKLFYAVRNVLAMPLNEDEAIEMLADFDRESNGLIAFLHFLLSTDKNGRYLFLSDQEKINKSVRRLFRQESMMDSPQKSKYWIPLQVKPLPSSFPALENDQEANYNEAPASSAIVAGDEAFVPRCYDEIDAFAVDDDGSDLQNLMEEYHSLTLYLDSDYSKRLRLAALICVRGGDDAGELESQKNLVRFCINYYKYHYYRVKRNVNVEDSGERIHSAMLDLAIYGLQNPSANAEIVSSLPNWFQYAVRGFASIDQLLQDYAQNRTAYAAIIKLLSDTEYSNVANKLGEILNFLLATANRLGTNALDIQSYQLAQSRLNESSPARDWWEMFAALNEMLRQAINKLDQRPSLKIRLFNAETGLKNDGLYGEVENTGREPAYRLELQATFPNNDAQPMSPLYRLSALRPNEKAAFAVSYRAVESLIELEYILNLSYSYKETRFAADPRHDRLTIVSSSASGQMIPPKFDTEGAISFTVNENGKIVSNDFERKDFKGRKTEIKKLEDLLKGDDFSNYRSAIVQGIKRSGKTSLLNYLRTYIRAKKGDNTVHLFFDCQSIQKPYIYKAFFKSVLEELPLEFPQILEHPSWPDFNAKWKIDEEKGDRDPADMSLFFRQLHSMMDGKGLYLIIDEFDVLISRLDQDMGYDSLLQALRSLQMNTDCQGAVHMILCGSNHLLTYNQTGSTFNQMFQSYDTISVGQMLAADIQKMITDWLARYPFIRFAGAKADGASPSIQWIEQYTGGLVWYTKLLVNEAIRKVLVDDKRDCVYPSDICDAFNSIINFNNCRQLIEGCGSDDMIVIDAMQSLSDRPGMYVSNEHLMQRLEPHLNSEQVRRSLSKLTESVELLEQKSPSIKSYRFRIELYRRYFRTLLWLDNHESRFSTDGNPDNRTGGDCFAIDESDANIETVDSNSAFE